MKRLLCYMLVCFFILSGVSTARDRSHSKDGLDLPRGKWWRMPEVAKELNINSDEQAKFDDLYFKYRNQKIDLKSTVEKEQLELERIIEKEKFDESACRDQFQKVIKAKNKVSIERFNFLIEVRKLLGYERFQQLIVKFKKIKMKKSKKNDGRKRDDRKRK